MVSLTLHQRPCLVSKSPCNHCLSHVSLCPWLVTTVLYQFSPLTALCSLPSTHAYYYSTSFFLYFSPCVCKFLCKFLCVCERDREREILIASSLSTEIVPANGKKIREKAKVSETWILAVIYVVVGKIHKGKKLTTLGFCCKLWSWLHLEVYYDCRPCTALQLAIQDFPVTSRINSRDFATVLWHYTIIATVST